VKIRIEELGSFITEVGIEFALRFDKPIAEAQPEITQILKKIKEIIKEREKLFG
jgi:hypothetical protein